MARGDPVVLEFAYGLVDLGEKCLEGLFAFKINGIVSFGKLAVNFERVCNFALLGQMFEEVERRDFCVAVLPIL